MELGDSQNEEKAFKREIEELKRQVKRSLLELEIDKMDEIQEIAIKGFREV